MVGGDPFLSYLASGSSFEVLDLLRPDAASLLLGLRLPSHPRGGQRLDDAALSLYE